MKTINKILLMLVMIAMPALCCAQPESCKVDAHVKHPSISDFARAYCSHFEADSFEREALAAIIKGNARVGNTECMVDTKNGFVSYTAPIDGALETLEMCYWNSDNKNEKMVAINRITTAMGYDESFLIFYRYNAKTRKMRHIEPPLDRLPNAADLINRSKADKATLDRVLNSSNEDANRFLPAFQLPRNGKDITCRMADRNAIPKQMQCECKLVWNGNGFDIVAE